MGWSAPRVGHADNSAKHAARSEKCSVGGRRVLHRTKRARAARHRTKTRRPQRFEATTANKARCLRRGASANGVGWSASRVGRADNRAKNAARRDRCSVGGRLVLHVTLRARAARHVTKKNQYDGVELQPPTWRGIRLRSLGQRRGMERVASWPRRQPRQARSTQCVLCGRSAGYSRNEARGGRAPRD